MLARILKQAVHLSRKKASLRLPQRTVTAIRLIYGNPTHHAEDP
jgi:hypothetical protein